MNKGERGKKLWRKVELASSTKYGENHAENSLDPRGQMNSYPSVTHRFLCASIFVLFTVSSRVSLFPSRYPAKGIAWSTPRALLTQHGRRSRDEGSAFSVIFHSTAEQTAVRDEGPGTSARNT